MTATNFAAAGGASGPGPNPAEMAAFERRLDGMVRNGEIDENEASMLLAAFADGNFDTVEGALGPIARPASLSGVGPASAAQPVNGGAVAAVGQFGTPASPAWASGGADYFAGDAAANDFGWDALRSLAASGIIHPADVQAIEAAIARGDRTTIRGFIADLEQAEADAAFYGGDGDVRTIRSALATAIGEVLPEPEGVVHAVPGTPVDGRHTGYEVHEQIHALIPRTNAVLTIEDEYLDPNLLAGAEEGLLVDRFGRPLDASLIVGHSSIDSGNRGADPKELVTALNRLGVDVRPSIPVMNDGIGDIVHLDGRSLTDEERRYVMGEWNANWLPDTHGVTMVDEDGRPTIVYAQNMDHPGEGGSLYDPGDREAVILHEAGHALFMLLPEESRERLKARPDLKALYDEINTQDPPSDAIDEYLADAFRAYLTNPGWFKTHFPELADAIAEEVNATPLFQGVIQFN